MEDYIKIKLPNSDDFKSLKKDRDPFMKFWDFVVGNLGTEIKGFDVTSVKLTQEDYAVLKKHGFAWYKKQDVVKYSSKRRQESSFGFHTLNASPSEFYKNEEQPESGFAYVKPDWKEVQEENLKHITS